RQLGTCRVVNTAAFPKTSSSGVLFPVCRGGPRLPTSFDAQSPPVRPRTYARTRACTSTCTSTKTTLPTYRDRLSIASRAGVRGRAGTGSRGRACALPHRAVAGARVLIDGARRSGADLVNGDEALDGTHASAARRDARRALQDVARAAVGENGAAILHR